MLVDEYQDTNTLQAEILYRLSPEGKGLTVVGDDAQSIYAFRAATVRNILDFPKHYPNATIVTLEQNYRSTQPILEATNRVIGLARERYTKNLWSERAEGQRPRLVNCEDEADQAEYVIRQILEHREAGIDLRRQAVLFRASHHSMLLEAELARAEHPLPQVRRAEVRRDGPRQGPDGLSAAGREPPRRGRRRAAAAAAAGHRAGQGAAVDGDAAGKAAAISRSGPSGSRRPARPKLWPKFVALLAGLGHARRTTCRPRCTACGSSTRRCWRRNTTTSSRGSATWSSWS